MFTSPVNTKVTRGEDLWPNWGGGVGDAAPHIVQTIFRVDEKFY